MQELYHSLWERFTSIAEVQGKVSLLRARWNKITPAIVQLAVEMGQSSPETDELNGIFVSTL